MILTGNLVCWFIKFHGQRRRQLVSLLHNTVTGREIEMFEMFGNIHISLVYQAKKEQKAK